MKSIKFFKYKNTSNFLGFIAAYDYKLEDVIGFSYAGQKQYRYNVLKLYRITFKDGEYEYFKIAYFKSFNEMNQCRLGFKGDKLLRWYEDADVRKYKVKDVWDMKDEYVIER